MPNAAVAALNQEGGKAMIIPAGDRTTESEMQLAVVAFLATCAYGEAPFTGSGRTKTAPQFTSNWNVQTANGSLS